MNLIRLGFAVAVLFLTLSSLTARASGNVLPVEVIVRKSVLDHHVNSARFENTSDKALVLHVVMERGNGKAQKSFTLNLAPNQTREIGPTQGWKGFSGDRITVSSKGYASFAEQVP